MSEQITMEEGMRIVNFYGRSEDKTFFDTLDLAKSKEIVKMMKRAYPKIHLSFRNRFNFASDMIRYSYKKRSECQNK